MDEKRIFINSFCKAMSDNSAAIFAGAGLSRNSGFVSWKELLSDMAIELGLQIEKEYDLISLAQYYKNEHNNRNTINLEILNCFSYNTSENKLLDLITSLPIETFWTTNYDRLIEDTLRIKWNKKVDVKINQNSLSSSLKERDAVVYKMHGDILDASNAVITKDDYEIYELSHKLFVTALQGDLISKTFAFVGFSFDDPNINYILSRIRILLGENQREHYCFIRKIKQDEYIKIGKTNEDYIYDLTKQNLKIEDLKRYGIRTILIDEYEEIYEIFSEINKKHLLDKVFVSGSARDYGNFKDSYYFLNKLGYELINKNYKLVTGFVEGVGPQLLNGALNAMSDKKIKLEKYICIKHLPLINGKSEHMDPITKEIYQNNMISTAGVIIFLFGNNYYDGKLSNSNGVLKEFERAKKLNKYIIPVGATGFASKVIFDEVKSNIKSYSYLENYLDKLENPKTTDELVNTILKLLEELRKI